MALSSYLNPELEQKLNEGLGPLSQAMQSNQAPTPTQQTPMDDNARMAGVYMKAAEMAAAGGLTEHSNNFLKIAKMYGGGGQEADYQTKTINKLGPDGKMHYYSMNPRTGQFDVDQGLVPDESFKFTGASVFRGQDGNWWRWNPTTGNPEFNEGGQWKYDPNRAVPDAVPKELGRTPGAAIDKAVQMDTIRGNIARIRENINPEWIGPVAGRAYAVQEALTGLPDSMQSVFYADVNDLGDMLLRARSGAQINEQEYQRLRKLVPTPNLPPKVFNERLNRFETQLMQAMEAQQRRLGGARYMAPAPVPMESGLVTGTTKKQSGRFTIEEVK